MFNPAEINNLRAAVAKDPGLNSFSGGLLQRIPVMFEDASCAVWRGANEVAQFRLPDRVFGVPEVPSCMAGIADTMINLPVPTIYEIAKGRVVGHSAVIDPAGRLSMPAPVSNRNQVSRLLDANSSVHEGFLLQEHDNCVTLLSLSPFHADVIDKTALFIHDLEAGNYGSFIIRQLPQLIVAQMAKLRFDCYITPSRTPWLMQALELLGMPNLPIYTTREVAARPFQSILITSGCDTEGFFAKNVATRMRSLAETLCAGSGPDQKIYVSRLLSSTGRRFYRVLQNEPEIEERAQAAGYRVVYPETLSLAEQLKAFGAASHIFGPSGSGMLNTAFARTGAKVADLESFTYCVRQHAKVYCSSGKKFSFGFGTFTSNRADEPLPFKSWIIPPAILADVLDWLEE